ncbi:MAG TPA: hypothetical protein VGC30_10595 [Dokdonella sp.]
MSTTPWFVLPLAIASVSAPALSPPEAGALLQGRYDNRAQVAAAAAAAPGAVPHVSVAIEPTAQPDWTLWRVHLEADAEHAFDQTWAMQTRTEYDGSTALIPYYPYKPAAAPSAATFDPQGWLSLEACALRGAAAPQRIQGMSEGEPCVAVTMSLGPLRALLPVGLDREGDRLQLDLNYRGARTRIDARREP